LPIALLAANPAVRPTPASAPPQQHSRKKRRRLILSFIATPSTTRFQLVLFFCNCKRQSTITKRPTTAASSKPNALTITQKPPPLNHAKNSKPAKQTNNPKPRKTPKKPATLNQIVIIIYHFKTIRRVCFSTRSQLTSIFLFSIVLFIFNPRNPRFLCLLFCYLFAFFSFNSFYLFFMNFMFGTCPPLADG
jgi:hypothetical protein